MSASGVVTPTPDIVVPFTLPGELAGRNSRQRVVARLQEVHDDLLAMEQSSGIERAVVEVLAVSGVDLARTAVEMLDAAADWQAVRDLFSRAIERIRAAIETFTHSAVASYFRGATVVVGLLAGVLELFRFTRGLF
jgi:hypothetical protein